MCHDLACVRACGSVQHHRDTSTHTACTANDLLLPYAVYRVQQYGRRPHHGVSSITAAPPARLARVRESSRMSVTGRRIRPQLTHSTRLLTLRRSSSAAREAATTCGSGKTVTVSAKVHIYTFIFLCVL